MISRMYVKSYLRPDNTRRTKRKTEEIAVYDPSSASAVTPLVFKFHQPLSYDGVDPQMIADRVVDVAVCVTQRYTRRGYVVATWNMPLDGAIKRLRRETFPMRQYLVTALPDNMQVILMSCDANCGIFFFSLKKILFKKHLKKKNIFC